VAVSNRSQEGFYFISEQDRYKSTHPLNAFTVDVEDYYHVSAFEGSVTRDQWDRMPSRIEYNMERILGLLEVYGVKATFFTLGWVAERFPQLVRKIADAGHEIASHGYQHIRINQQSQEQFREDVIRTKKLLEDVTGNFVVGYRAASFSICLETLWALNILEESGYAYSSSVYPINHDLYGMPQAPRFPFRLHLGGLLEIPITTIYLMGQNLPCGGGGYFRLFPYYITSWAMRRVNKQDQQSNVFYFHPWEIDPHQPRLIGVSFKSRFRHYVNLNKMEERLKQLLSDFNWERMDRVFQLP
jgi:polysaccharide deacetylase family protein (PEP-CTERM system associated)